MMYQQNSRLELTKTLKDKQLLFSIDSQILLVTFHLKTHPGSYKFLHAPTNHLKLTQAEEEVRELQKKMQQLENDLDQTQEKLMNANQRLEEKEKALQNVSSRL